MKKNRDIISQEISLSDWYTSVIENAKLIHYSSIKGFMTLLPRGWAIWNLIQKELNNLFEKLHIQNVALPTLFPYSYLFLEAKHVEGFKPELFLVKNKGDEVLKDPYVLRPTSEIVFCKLWSEILHTYSQLPMLYNQWCNVFRVEKNTRPFLRNSEFYWQEMHGAFADQDSCIDMVKKMHDVYNFVINNVLMIPTLSGLKTPNETFAGALQTYTLETIMPDGQALQSATSHNLDQNFAKAFNIKFQSKENKYEYVYTMSAGMSTRIIGSLIMSHGDDNGLVLPFKVAPIQIEIITLMKKNSYEITEIAKKIKSELDLKYRVSIDDSKYSLGYKINKYEIYGVPLLIIIGPNDIKNNKVTIKWRNSIEKINVDINELTSLIDSSINDYDKQLYDAVKKRYEQQIVIVNDFKNFKLQLDNKKVILVPWSGNDEDEKKIKELTNATIRCIISKPINDEKCFYTKKPAKNWVYFARAY